KGELSTGFLEEEYPDGFAGSRLNDARRRRLAAVALAIHLVERERRAALPGRLRPGEALPWRADWTVILYNERLTVKAVSGQTKVPAEIEMVLEEGGAPVTVASAWSPGEPVWRGAIGGESIFVQVRQAVGGVRLFHRGAEVLARVMRPAVAELDALMPEKAPPDTSRLLLCPMPGLVVSLAVETGQ